MIEVFNNSKFFLIGSAYFFKNYPDFVIHDLDYGTFISEEDWKNSSINKFKNTCKTIKDENDYFIWKKDTPENLIELAYTKDPICAGKYLIPEICNQIGFTIDHLKKLKDVFNKIDCKHQYENIIYNYYILNDEMKLTEEQRLDAYKSYLTSRPIADKENEYKKDENNFWVQYSLRPKKNPIYRNSFGRAAGTLGVFILKESERSFAINEYNFLKKIYPEVIAYESINPCEPNVSYYLTEQYLYTIRGPKVSMDLDLTGISWEELEDIFKQEFINKNIHCDLQVSPHGAHFITDSKNFDSINTITKNISDSFKKETTFKRILIDSVVHIKILDGIIIDGLKIETIKNWT